MVSRWPAAALLIALLPLALAAATLDEATSPLADDAHRPAGAGAAHAAHQHGSATLAVAIDGGWLEVELVAPAVDLLGFERLPATATERAALQSAVAHLREGAPLLGLPAAAGCRQESVHIASPLMAAYDNRDRERPTPLNADAVAPESHPDFQASYRFECADPAALTQLHLQLFERFPGIQRVTVPWLREGRQSSITVSASSPVVELR